MTTTTVELRLKADAVEFSSAINSAQKKVNQSFQQMRDASKKASAGIKKDTGDIALSVTTISSGFSSAAKSMAAFALGGAGLTAIAKASVDLADNIAKTSSKLGLATDEFQRYTFAAELSGVTTEQFSQAFGSFTRRIGEAAQGFGEAGPALQALGIAIKNVDGSLRPANQVFDEAVTKLADVEDASLRNALAAKLFGEEGVRLLQVGKNLETLKQKADELGTVIPEESIRNAERIQDAISIFQKQMTRAVTVALTKFAPAIEAAGLALGGLAENFGTVVHWLGNLAKLIVAIKLGTFVNGLYATGAAAVAAAGGIRALVISMRALKIASVVGIALLALEAVLAKFTKSLDSGAGEIGAAMEEAQKRLTDATEGMADATKDGLSKTILARQNFNKDIKGLVDAELKVLEEGLKREQALLTEKQRGLEKIKGGVDDAVRQFEEAFKKISGVGRTNQDPTLIDFAGQITKAKQALKGGDLQSAQQAALDAKDVVLALAESGKYSELVLSGALNEAKRIQEEASKGLIAAQEAAVSQAEQAVQKIQSQINLIKSITFDFDEVGSLEGAKTVIDQIRRVVEQNPIVVPVVLGSPGGGGDLPGYATGGLIRGPGSGTSDSILARLSNGEYVIKADAVRRYGLDFLNALNAQRLPAFASGGLVSARQSSNSTINLTLPGGAGPYPMQASSGVAKSLQQEVIRQALKAGRKITP